MFDYMSSNSSRPKALSASSTSTWLQCPMKFRLVYIDGFREPPSPATTRGTLVHRVLEDLYGLPAERRTSQAARDLVQPAYSELFAGKEDFEAMFPQEALKTQWLNDAYALVERYFTVENPQRLEPIAREQLVDAPMRDGILLRGFIDRVDKAPSGALRVVDYKTGRSPKPRYVEDKLFQMRFYALLLRCSGAGLPARTQLVFLADGKILTMDPTADSIDAFEHHLVAIWEQIENAIHTEHFSPKRQPLCNWCGVKHLCPLYSDDTPQMSADGAQAMLTVKTRGER